MSQYKILSLVSMLALAGCGGAAQPEAESPSAANTAAQADGSTPPPRVAPGPTGEGQGAVASPNMQKDRAAILAMAGEYKVGFHFEETVSYRKGYELKEPYDSAATEIVAVVADEPEFISLQHVLVIGKKDPRVIKHWRQDWTYQDTKVMEYRGSMTWEHRELEASEVAGTWSQAVFQVDDSPRYEGWGRWVHRGKTSYWESEETWRPLPRREYTKRSDYHVMVVKNRHALTPKGWVHEQDNYKLVLGSEAGAEPILCREMGVNTYEKKELNLAAGHEYWNKTQGYWKDVRQEWSRVFGANNRFGLRDEVGGDKLYKQLFSLAEEVKKADEYEAGARTAEIRAIIEKFLETE